MIQRQRHRLAVAALFLGVWPHAVAAAPEVKAGGVALALPGPPGDFAEAAYKLRTTFFEVLVPSTNRLLTAYAPAQSLIELNGRKAPVELDTYAMVEVPRQAEYSDCTPEIFEQILKTLGPSMGKFDGKNVGALEEEINLRLKSLGTTSVELGRPEMLGGIFQKTNASGFAMLMAFKQDDHSTTMATGVAMLRVKQRLIFAYLYRKYESPDAVTWVRKNLEPWVDAILANNK